MPVHPRDTNVPHLVPRAGDDAASSVCARAARRPTPILCLATTAVAAAIGVGAAATRPGRAEAADPMTGAEAAKHSVLAHPAFWLIPDRQGCVETTAHGPAAAPVAAPANWEKAIWACAFTADFGVARCQNLGGVDVKTRQNAVFTDRAFVVRPDRDPSWPATFGGLTEAFVSAHETLVTNARREYLLQTESFKRDPAAWIHTVCTGHWDPMTAKELSALDKRTAAAKAAAAKAAAVHPEPPSPR